MGLHGGLGHEEPRCDLCIGQPLGHGHEHLPLTVGQRRHRREHLSSARSPATSSRCACSSSKRRVMRGDTTASPHATMRIARHQLARRHIFEKEPAGAGPQRSEGVGVEVERREDQHPHGGITGHDASCRLDPVDHRHTDVHEQRRPGSHLDARAIASSPSPASPTTSMSGSWSGSCESRDAAAPGRRRGAPGSVTS